MDAALRETEEETSIRINKADLRLVKIIESYSHDSITGKTNNALRAIYSYFFTGKMSDLKQEKGKGIGFEVLNLKELQDETNEKRKKVIPTLLNQVHMDLYKTIVKENTI